MSSLVTHFAYFGTPPQIRALDPPLACIFTCVYIAFLSLSQERTLLALLSISGIDQVSVAPGVIVSYFVSVPRPLLFSLLCFRGFFLRNLLWSCHLTVMLLSPLLLLSLLCVFRCCRFAFLAILSIFLHAIVFFSVHISPLVISPYLFIFTS